MVGNHLTNIREFNVFNGKKLQIEAVTRIFVNVIVLGLVGTKLPTKFQMGVNKKGFGPVEYTSIPNFVHQNTKQFFWTFKVKFTIFKIKVLLRINYSPN